MRDSFQGIAGLFFLPLLLYLKLSVPESFESVPLSNLALQWLVLGRLISAFIEVWFVSGYAQLLLVHVVKRKA
jgi:hypothetical protein